MPDINICSGDGAPDCTLIYVIIGFFRVIVASIIIVILFIYKLGTMTTLVADLIYQGLCLQSSHSFREHNPLHILEDNKVGISSPRITGQCSH